MCKLKNRNCRIHSSTTTRHDIGFITIYHKTRTLQNRQSIKIYNNNCRVHVTRICNFLSIAGIVVRIWMNVEVIMCNTHILIKKKDLRQNTSLAKSKVSDRKVLNPCCIIPTAAVLCGWWVQNRCKRTTTRDLSLGSSVTWAISRRFHYYSSTYRLKFVRTYFCSTMN